MVFESTTTRYFSEAVRQLLEQSGHGAQSALAKRCGMSVSYLNDLLSGRKPYWPDPIKERVAEAFGYSVAELLEIGEHFVNDSVFWPHAKRVQDTAAKSIERMSRIYQLAAKDTGLNLGHVLFAVEAIVNMFPKGAAEYQAGSVSDARLYHEALNFCRVALGKQGGNGK